VPPCAAIRSRIVDSSEHTTTLELLERLIPQAAAERRDDLRRSVDLVRRLLDVTDADTAHNLLQDLLSDAHQR
jgi:hypothetical protein